ncbi:hypothetical protein [Ligilactobacillus acidipiscis]|uniref:hypothetical protein n=1 Tax=Ligilactobacillus acidipiscis TaxID=89059 RepID=UPI0023F9708E|nr:hypothetical protein [Ligilactobacillus acidipiscis]WEV56392.1 hypothetical protein OZX66_09180 [Ligilactobacillus acidipiscis]
MVEGFVFGMVNKARDSFKPKIKEKIYNKLEKSADKIYDKTVKLGKTKDWKESLNVSKGGKAYE